MDFEIPSSVCFPGLGILGFPSAHTAPGLVSLGLCILSEWDFLFYFSFFQSLYHPALVQMKKSEILYI